MLLKLNRFLVKMMPIITPTSVILGILLSTYLSDYSFLVPWLFAFITFEGSLGLNFRSIKGAILHPFPVFIALGFLHIIMPLWAWGIGHITFSGDSLTITGLILGMAIPTAITSFIWVSIYNGNTALTLSIILIDSLLSPFIVPLTLSLFIGQTVEMDIMGMMKGLILMIVLPSILAMILNELTRGKVEKVWRPRLSPISKLLLATVVALNGAVVAPYFQEITFKIILIALTVILIATSGYAFAFCIAKLLKMKKENIITLTYIGGMRNISGGAVIAVTYFPSAVVLTVVLGMLFQQILASLFGSFLEKHFHKREIVYQEETGLKERIY